MLTLTVPDVADAIAGTTLRRALTAEWPKFALYLISFFMVAQAWVGHHFLFSNFRRADSLLVWLNNIFLATVAIIPFSTALLGHYAGQPHNRIVAALVYGGIWTVGAACLSGTFWYASGRGSLLHEASDDRIIAQVRLYSAVGPLVYFAFTLLALLNFWVSLIGFAFVPLFYVVQGVRAPQPKT